MAINFLSDKLYLYFSPKLSVKVTSVDYSYGRRSYWMICVYCWKLRLLWDYFHLLAESVFADSHFVIPNFPFSRWLWSLEKVFIHWIQNTVDYFSKDETGQKDCRLLSSFLLLQLECCVLCDFLLVHRFVFTTQCLPCELTFISNNIFFSPRRFCRPRRQKK